MKTNHFLSIIMIGAALAASSCAKSELTAPQPAADSADGGSGVTMTVIPSVDEVKTTIVDNMDGTFSPLWSAGDAISMSFSAAGAAKFQDFNKKLVSASAATAEKTTFSGIIYAPAKSGDYSFYAVYPQGSVKEGSAPDGIIVDLPQSQIVPTASFDPKADILFGQKKTINITNTVKDLKNVGIRFARIEALARIKVDRAASTAQGIDLDEQVLGVSLSNGAGINFTGTIKVNPENPDEFTFTGEGRTSVEAVPESSVSLKDLDLILGIAPCSFLSGAKLSIAIRTATHLISKEITLSEATKFEAGAVKKLTCRIDGSWTVKNVPLFGGGSGTQSSPYLISYPADLAMLSTLSNGAQASTYSAAGYKQTADINMEGIATFHPISYTSKFTGVYDGGGFTVSNLSVKGVSGKPTGLFATISGAKIRNLKIRDIKVYPLASNVGAFAGSSEASALVERCELESELVSDQLYLGGIIGYCAKSQINNCTVNGTIKNLYLSNRYDASHQENAIVGGFAGQFCQGSSSTGCTMNGKVYATGSCSGGFAGYHTTSLISGFHLTKGSEVSSDENLIGGVLGYQGGSSNASMTTNRIDNCIIEGTVGGRGNYVGGISGRTAAGEIKGCLVSSSCSVSTYKHFAGGIVGGINPTSSPVRITDCAAYCNVSAAYDVGGIAGWTQAGNASSVSTIYITNCAFVGGKLSATMYIETGGARLGRVGGIVGNLIGSAVDNGSSTIIANCYSRPKQVAGTLKATTPCAGGIAGLLGARYSITNCYNDLDLSNLLFDGRTISQFDPSKAFTAAAYGALYGSFNGKKSSDKISLKNLYYMSSLQEGQDFSTLVSNGVVSDCGTFTTATAGADLVDRLNAGADAFNATYPVVKAVKWVVGSDGVATLSNILGDPSVAKKNPLRISVIGDSISTFRGYIPNGYGAHYPTTDGALDFVQQTYWWKLINEYMTNAVLEKNISNSGTTVAKRDDTFERSASGGHCFIYRYTNNGIGNPDIVLIAGGTNDWTHIKDMGDGIACKDATSAPSESYLNSLYAQSTLNVADSAKFCPAYVHLLRSITTDHPGVKIVCIIGDRESKGQQDAIHKMAAHYGAKVIDLLAVNGFNENTYMPKHDYATGGVHPGAEGHAFIANKIYAEVGPWLEERP